MSDRTVFLLFWLVVWVADISLSFLAGSALYAAGAALPISIGFGLVLAIAFYEIVAALVRADRRGRGE